MSAHCELESIPGLGFIKCDATETPASHCESDNCNAVEGGQFFQIQKSLSASFEFVGLPFEVLVPLKQAGDQPTILPIPKNLPELPVSWQFISRTSLPVRAPSLVS